MKNNLQLYQIAKSYLGTKGAEPRKFCGLPSSAAWCCAFVSFIFNKGDDSKLWYGGKKVVYCPSAMTWCRANLAEIPIYLAMPMDVIFFDWNLNGTADHIGFVRDRKSDQSVYTIEGNTDGGKVALKTRAVKYVAGTFRPHFTGTYTIKKLDVDGQFGYNSIAMLRKALGLSPSSILDKATVKALQKKVGVAQDGSWGTKTSKAVQSKLCGFNGKDCDGYFGEKSVKALQKWINKTCGYSDVPKVKTVQDKVCDWAEQMAKDDTYIYVTQNDSDSKTKKCPICANVAKGSKYHGFNCIRFVGASYYHGGGIPIKSSNHTLVTTALANKMLKATPPNALKMWTDRNGGKWDIIKNGNKKLSVSSLKPADILICYDKEGSGANYKHMALYDGDGYIVDAASKDKGILKRKYTTLNSKPLIAMRYLGK